MTVSQIICGLARVRIDRVGWKLLQSDHTHASQEIVLWGFRGHFRNYFLKIMTLRGGGEGARAIILILA